MLSFLGVLHRQPWFPSSHMSPSIKLSSLAAAMLFTFRYVVSPRTRHFYCCSYILRITKGSWFYWLGSGVSGGKVAEGGLLGCLAMAIELLLHDRTRLLFFLLFNTKLDYVLFSHMPEAYEQCWSRSENKHWETLINIKWKWCYIAWVLPFISNHIYTHLPFAESEKK